MHSASDTKACKIPRPRISTQHHRSLLKRPVYPEKDCGSVLSIASSACSSKAETLSHKHAQPRNQIFDNVFVRLMTLCAGKTGSMKARRIPYTMNTSTHSNGW